METRPPVERSRCQIFSGCAGGGTADTTLCAAAAVWAANMAQIKAANLKMDFTLPAPKRFKSGA
jgi:hypothetical protein